MYWSFVRMGLFGIVGERLRQEAERIDSLFTIDDLLFGTAVFDWGFKDKVKMAAAGCR